MCKKWEIFFNRFSPLIIYLDFEAAMMIHKLIKKRNYRQSYLSSDCIDLQPFSEIIFADKKMVAVIHLREKEKI